MTCCWAFPLPNQENKPVMTDEANGSSQGIGKGMDRLVEADRLDPLGVHL